MTYAIYDIYIDFLRFAAYVDEKLMFRGKRYFHIASPKDGLGFWYVVSENHIKWISDLDMQREVYENI